MPLRDLNQISIGRDISETSQKHLKRDDFFVTCLRRLKYISKKDIVYNRDLRPGTQDPGTLELGIRDLGLLDPRPCDAGTMDSDTQDPGTGTLGP